MRLFLSVTLAFFLSLLGDIASADDSALYEGEAPVDNQSAAQRTAALPRALAQALVKVTGEAGAGSNPAFAGALSSAGRMVQQYRYRQDVVTSNGVPQLKLFLIASFNRAAVDGLVASVGRTVWPTPRPRPLVWLAIDDGRGARLVGEGQASAVAPLVKRAGERGMSVSLPKGDLQDQTLGSAQAVWREDAAAVRSAAARYGSAPVLMGRMQRGEGGWTAQWLLLDGTTEVERWSAVDADARVVLAAGADGAASALSKSFSTRILGGPAGDYDVVIDGLARAEDYGRVLQYLQGLPIVKGVEVQEAIESRLQLHLQLRTDIEGLKRFVAGGDVLQPISTESDATTVLRLEP